MSEEEKLISILDEMNELGSNMETPFDADCFLEKWVELFKIEQVKADLLSICLTREEIVYSLNSRPETLLQTLLLGMIQYLTVKGNANGDVHRRTDDGQSEVAG